jgi:predicted nucleic acid-binding OB-fold protein|tara:strand:- start:4706 stop:5488 length:783 start_codon:yes stop_codon:yes gene_type:complete
MSGFSRDRNIKVPKKVEKNPPVSQSNYLPSRPAEGRVEVPKKVAKPPRSRQQNNQQRRRGNNRRNAGSRGNSQRQQKPRRPTPLDDEVWARVIENDSKTNVIVALGESKMMLGRYAGKNPATAVGERIYVGVDSNKRTEIGDILGMAKMDRLSSSAISDLPLVTQMFVEENQAHFIKAFFNIAGPLSLKQHAFELLPGIGKKKALQMVEIRGSSGFSSLEQLNESCAIDAAELLAKRFVAEIEDKNLQPRLSELLLPVSA